MISPISYGLMTYYWAPPSGQYWFLFLKKFVELFDCLCIINLKYIVNCTQGMIIKNYNLKYIFSIKYKNGVKTFPV